MSSLERKRRRRRPASRLAIAIAALALVGPTSAQAQVPSVQFDPNTGVFSYRFGTDPAPAPVEPVTTIAGIGSTGNQLYVYVFDPVNPITAGPGCQNPTPDLKQFAACPVQLQQLPSIYEWELAPRYANNFRFFEYVPLNSFPGGEHLRGGDKADDIHTGLGPDQINSGKGPDEVDPGGGRDTVNTGPQNDKIDTKDGEKDTVNGGSGKRDEATVDKKDKVKNVEVIRRK